MIICDRFEGDILFVQDIQHDLYWRHVSAIVGKARDVYLLALRVLDMETQLGFDAKEKMTFDHRTLQYMHDVIAARYRFLNRERLNQCAIPGVLSELSDEGLFAGMWLKYYTCFIDWLHEARPEFVAKVLIATTYSNPDPRGKDAEDFLFDNMQFFLPENIHLEAWEFAFRDSEFM